MEIPRKKEKSTTTPRSILIGLVMVIINCYWIMMSFFFGSGESGTITLMYNVVFSVLVLNLVNSFLFRHFPKFSLKQSELLTVYVMLTIASVLLFSCWYRSFQTPINLLTRKTNGRTYFGCIFLIG